MREGTWPEIRIGNLGGVFTGRTPPTEHPTYFGDDHPFITPGDMHQGKYARVTQRSVSHEGAKLLRRIKVPANSVCVSCIGWQMGEAIMTDRPSFTNQQINTIVPNDNVEPSFLYYSLRPRKQELLSLGAMTGVRTPILNKSAFCDLKVKIPPLPVQRRIAGILSAYDDLIENNTRRIKILEEMARMLYREWFVLFRFPGHEEVKLVDSTLDRIPEGWEVAKFTDLSEILSGGTPKTTAAEYWGGLIPFYSPADAPSSFYVISTEKQITELGLSKCNSRLYPKDTVFITARGTVGSTVMSAGDMAMNQSCYALLGREGITQPYLFLLTLHSVDYLRKNTGGATFQTIVIDTFRRFDVVKPALPIIDSFTEQARPLLDGILNLLRRNSNLRRTRDLLLPRLVSGDLPTGRFEKGSQ